MNQEKYEVGYKEFKDICLNMVDYVKARMFLFHGVVCISRGGLTASHIIAKALQLPVGYVAFYEPGKPTSMGISRYDKSYLVVDDMVDAGRTMEAVREHFRNAYPASCFLFAAVFNVGSYDRLDIVGRTERDKWLVMPNEDPSKVVVGDKGLFREGTNRYGAVATL